jgi:hypothetical protein
MVIWIWIYDGMFKSIYLTSCIIAKNVSIKFDYHRDITAAISLKNICGIIELQVSEKNKRFASLKFYTNLLNNVVFIINWYTQCLFMILCWLCWKIQFMNFKRTWRRLFQKHIVRTKLNICVISVVLSWISV